MYIQRIPTIILLIAASKLLLIFGCSDYNNKALVHIKAGKKYYNNLKFDSSLYHFNNALKLDPSNSEVSYYLGKIYYQINNYSEALKFLNFAEKQGFKPDSTAYIKLDILLELENYDDYIEYCNKLLSDNSTNYRMYFKKAVAFFTKAQSEPATETKVELYKEALKNVDISLNLNKNDYETFVLRGAIRNGLEDYKGAIGDFDIAINQEKKDSSIISNAYRWKGITEESLNNFIYAESLLDSAIILEKDQSLHYINRGDIRISLKKVALACEDYRKALDFGNNEAVDRIRENCKGN